MKVAIGYRVQNGPWGGGNRFVEALVEALSDAGHVSVETLEDADIDIILMIDPRRRNPAVSFTPGAVRRYLKGRNGKALVVHRINECDERKATLSMNARLRLANACADHTVFIATWLKGLAVWRPQDAKGHSVILNGGDVRVFHANGARVWDGREPLRLVTHHWGGNWMKGFDVYSRIDRMLGEGGWCERIEFTYIGNLPPGFAFAHARHLAPMTGHELARELRRHHVYLTASINEPAGMHHVEGALCGLPLIFRNSGALTEYCTGFGERFDNDHFEPALGCMMDGYDRWKTAMESYPHVAERMTGAYIALFEKLSADRDEIVAQRKPKMLSFLLNQIAW